MLAVWKDDTMAGNSVDNLVELLVDETVGNLVEQMDGKKAAVMVLMKVDSKADQTDEKMVAQKVEW